MNAKFDEIGSRSINEIKNSLSKLSRINLKYISSLDYFEECKIALRGVVMPLIAASSNSAKFSNDYGIFRARSCTQDHLFENVSELWEPPPNLAKLNRCNESGQPMLYCANHFSTAVIETGARINTFWTVAKFDLPAEKPLLCLALGFRKHSFLSQTPKGNSNNDFYIGISESLQKKNNLIDDFIHKSFRVSNSYNPQIYKQTNAITKCFLGANSSNVQGLLYPSVAAGLKGANLAFFPTFARKNLILKSAYFFKLLKLDQKKIEIEPYGAGVISNDKILWSQAVGELF